MSLVERIENYIRTLLEKSEGALRLQRNELADLFSCAPSQINYVLKTRFTMERGFLVESQRGGGGFIEIRELMIPAEHFMYAAIEIIGHSLSQMQAINLIYNLEEKGILTLRESAMLQAVINRNNLNIELPYRDFIRAQLLKAALGALMKNHQE